MSRMSGFLITIIAITAIFMIAACGYPLGSIGDIDYDNFWVMSTRPTYKNSESLSRSDLSAFASFQGAVDAVPIDEVDIQIRDHTDGTLKFEPVNGGHVFAGPGTKLIRASYRGMQAEYSIHVLDPNDGTVGPGYGTGGAIDGGGGGSFITW